MQFLKQSFWMRVMTYQVPNLNTLTCQCMHNDNLPPYLAHCPLSYTKMKSGMHIAVDSSIDRSCPLFM